MDKDDGNKTQRIYRCRSYYALSKLIVDNGLEDLWRRGNPDSSEFTCYDRSSCTRFRIDRVYTNIKIASNIRINHTPVDTGRKLNVHKTFNLRPVSTGIMVSSWTQH